VPVNKALVTLLHYERMPRDSSKHRTWMALYWLSEYTTAFSFSCVVSFNFLWHWHQVEKIHLKCQSANSLTDSPPLCQQFVMLSLTVNDDLNLQAVFGQPI